uniref:Uncharacterized protein n=1 Tax=Cannabis sativa TaxID=3483 RepID=A0A803QC86_CANSA
MGRDLLTKGLVWKVGDGKSIQITSPNWLLDTSIVSFENNSPPLETTVSYFIKEDGLWDIDNLNNYFDKDLVNSVLKVPTDPMSKDCLIWGHNPSGTFTVNSAYHLANSNYPYPSSSNPKTFKS